MPPCPPENRGKVQGRRLVFPGGQGVPGDGEGRCGPGGGGVWRRGPSPPAAKQKAGAGGFAPAPAFQGASRPAAAPLGDRNAIRLAPETWQMRQEKGEVSAKTLPPVMAVSPIYPPLGMLPMACRYASTSSRKPSMPSRSETRSSPRPMCFIR